MKAYTIRHLHTYDEYRAIGEVQEETWGEGFIEMIPPSLILVAQKIGGIVAGAFSERGDLIAFVYGLPGRRRGAEIHWSHMLAVRPAWRGLGVGGALKQFQKDYVKGQGIRYINWTYDPLEAVNANLNIRRLGAVADEYVCDLYGDGSSSRLHRGIGTDRLIVTSHVYDEDRAEYLRGFLHPENPAACPAVISTDPVAKHDPGRPPALRIVIPENIQALKEQDPDRARMWRQATRKAFMHYFEQGYAVTGCYYNEEDGQYEYVLSAPAADQC